MADAGNGEIIPHELHPAEIPIRAPCKERALGFELDRD